MATQHWINKAGGNFATVTNWKHHHAPATGDSAVLNRASGPITSAVDETLANLTVNGSVNSLVISAGNFSATSVNNASTINVTGGTATFGGATSSKNTKLIEADGGVVTFTSTTLVQSTAGTVAAVGAGSTVTLDNTRIEGGNLSTSGGGLIETGDSKSTLNGATIFGAVTNNGTVLVNQSQNLTLDGKIVNNGELLVDGVTANSGLLVGASAVTLSGTGTVVLAADGYIAGAAAGAKMTNLSTIDGGGFIKGPLNLTNGASGVIDADGARMVINTGATVTNAGLMEATGGGGLLLIRSTTVNGSTGGSVTAATGAKIQLDGDTLLGGTVSVAGGATLQAITDSSTISGAAFNNAGQVAIGNGVNLNVTGSVNNSGTVTVAGAANLSGLVAGVGGMTLGGGGVVVLDLKGYIGGAGAGASLTNVDNTIKGQGFIKGPLTLTNDAGGIIDASTGRMVLNTGNTVTNDGLVESTSSGLLLVRNTTIDSSGGGTVTDGRRMQLDNSTLDGTTVGIGKGAILQSILHAATINMMGGTVQNSGTIIGGAGGLTINGDVANLGLVEEINGGLTVNGAVTGAGTTRIFGKGVLDVEGALTENAFFAAASTGQLALGDTAGFTGKVFGFSKTGKTSLDLKDVTFDASDTTSYSGTAAGGTLSILNSSSVVVATIKFSGDYRSSAWVLSADSGTGTVVTDPTATKTSSLVSAMASFGTSSGHASAPATVLTQSPHLLAYAHA
jgi:hypothetical protein